MYKILRLSDLCKILSISRSTLYRWGKDCPDFPKKIKLGPRTVGYLQSDIENWVASQKEVKVDSEGGEQ